MTKMTLDCEAGIDHRADVALLPAGTVGGILWPDFATEILSADPGMEAVGLEYLVTDGLPGAGLAIEPVLPLTLWELDAARAAHLRSPAGMPDPALRALGAACAHSSQAAHSEMRPQILFAAARRIREDWGNGRLLALYTREAVFFMSADLGGNLEFLDGEEACGEDGMARITARLFGHGYAIGAASAHERVAHQGRLLHSLEIHDAILAQQTGISVRSRLGSSRKTDR